MVPLRIERRFQESESCVLTSYTMRPTVPYGLKSIRHRQRKHPPPSRMNPWLLSGLILAGITAILTAVFVYYFPSAPMPVSTFIFQFMQSLSPYHYIVDVRTKQSYVKGHYPGAINIPSEYLEQELPTKIPVRRASILFYSNAGNRAKESAIIAHQMGYRNLTYVSGGDYKDMKNTPLQILKTITSPSPNK